MRMVIANRKGAINSVVYQVIKMLHEARLIITQTAMNYREQTIQTSGCTME